MLRDTRYAYTVGRIRVAETRMLDAADFDRMLELKTPEDVLKMLNERGYPDSRDYEEVLKAETRKLYDYMREITPNPELFSLFLYRNDCHNLKVLLKNEFFGVADESMVAENGVFGYDVLKTMVRERAFSPLPEIIRQGMEESMELFARTKDPQYIDIILDKAYHSYFSLEAGKLKNPYLDRLTRLLIDTGNVMAFVRIKKSMEDLDLLLRVMMDHGSVTPGEYAVMLPESMEHFRETLARTPYAVLAGQETAAGMEKESDDLIMRFLRAHKHKVFGIEPVIGYMMGKETEIGNVRIIMVGKINGIDRDAIRERLRLGYA
ncbi:MAG: V-type ATPase subunit [Clostridia bacterium]